MNEVLVVLAKNPLLPILWTGSSFFLGVFLGYWINLKLHKRQELNLVIDRVRAGLLSSHFGTSPSAVDTDLLRGCMSPRRWRGVIQALSAYEQAKKDTMQDVIGQPMLRRPDLVSAKLRTLLRVLKRS